MSIDDKLVEKSIDPIDDEIFLKILGELLSNKSSRSMIRILFEKEYYKNEISKKLNIRLNLVVHHLEKMELIGLLDITSKKISKKGKNHKYYKMSTKIFILSGTKTDFKFLF